MVIRMEAGIHHFPESPSSGGETGGSDGHDTAPTANWGTALRGTRFGPFEMVGTTGSTNDDLVARAAGHADDGLVLATDHQSAGRGRLDRRWEAPEGTNLTFSTLLRPDWLAEPAPGPDRRGLVTSALAVSVVEVLMALGLDAVVKWPNDVMLAGTHAGKVAGILAELVTGKRPAIVVGLGLNVAWPPLETAVSDEPVPPGATSLARAGLQAYRWRVMVDVLIAFDRQLADLDRPDGPERLRQNHLAVSATVANRVRLEQSGGGLIGEAVDLTTDGALVVQPDEGEVIKVHAGDVTHMREG